MAKHGGNGVKGKNGTTKDGAKISVPRARAREKIDDKTWRKWGLGQKRHPEAKIVCVLGARARAKSR